MVDLAHFMPLEFLNFVNSLELLESEQKGIFAVFGEKLGADVENALEGQEGKNERFWVPGIENLAEKADYLAVY